MLFHIAQIHSIIWDFEKEVVIFDEVEFRGRTSIKNIFSVPLTYENQTTCIFNVVVLLNEGAIDGGIYFVDAKINVKEKMCTNIFWSIFDSEGGELRNVVVRGRVQVSKREDQKVSVGAIFNHFEDSSIDD